ncbi:hypothetical protein BH20ACI3_BH20ACI3_39380 [soil metagenome]
MQQAAATYFRYAEKTRTPIFDHDTEDLFKLLNANNWIVIVFTGDARNSASNSKLTFDTAPPSDVRMGFALPSRQSSILGAAPLWGSAPEFSKTSDGGAKPPPHIGRQSRAAA